MDKKTIPSFEWDEKTEEIPAQKVDNFDTNIISIREALKKHPSPNGYLTLIGELLDRSLLDDAKQVADEFKKWAKSEKKNK